MRLLAQILVSGLALGLLAAAEIWRSHIQAMSAAERYVEGFSRLLAAQTESAVQAIDHTLIDMRDALLLAPSLAADDPAYRAAMKERLKGLPYVRALFVIGNDGFITHDTDYPSTPRVSLEDRDYFQVHRASPSLGLHIGRPLQSRSVGAWFLSFSRRVSKPDGSFGGIVVAALEPRFVQHFFKGLAPEKDDLLALLLKDGTLLACSPHDEASVGKRSDDIARLTGNGGVAWLKSSADGKRRMLSFRSVAGGAFVVVAGQTETRVYEAWREHTAVVGGCALVVWLLTAGLVVISQNYQRRAELEQARLAQGQRLEMIGRFAGGIAHDLGNTIRIARTTFSLLKPSLASQRDAMALVEEADRALMSAFDIIDRLLAYARGQELNPRPTDLAELIGGVAPMLRQAGGPRIELDLKLAGPLVCSIDPMQLESALLNLVLNSKDAMPEGGRIVIELREAKPPRRRHWLVGRTAAKRPWAEISVKDDGLGMPPEVADRAFEPFFTTRQGGSGLGLSQVLCFVQQSAGDVSIETEEGRGTTVRLLFPTCDPAGATAEGSA